MSLKNLSLFLLFLKSISLSFAQPQPINWQVRGIGGGGALYKPSINPANHNEIYVGCDMSDLFHTTNFGRSWDVVNFTKLQGGRNSKMCFTNNPSILYTITMSEDDIPIPVISDDGGATWTQLSGTTREDECFTIDVDYNHPERLVISYEDSVYFSGDYGQSFSAVNTSITDPNPYAGFRFRLAGVFFDKDNVFIGVDDGIYYSDNAGKNFSTLNIIGIPYGTTSQNEGIFSFAAAKQENTIRFFVLTANARYCTQDWDLGADYWGLARKVYSVNFGQTSWVERMNGLEITGNGPDFFTVIAMAENDTSTVYLGGSNSNAFPNVKKTVDGGENWVSIFNTNDNANIITGWSGDGGDRRWSYGEVCFGLTVAKNDPNKVAISDYGFVHVSDDGGMNWKQTYVTSETQNAAGSMTPRKKFYVSSGMENTSCWQVMWSSPENLFIAFSDINGIRSEDSGKTWSFDYNGHDQNTMYRIEKNPLTGMLYAGTSTRHDIYQSTHLNDDILGPALGRIISSDDSGKNWNLVHDFQNPVFWLALDPNNLNRMYASVVDTEGVGGVGGIYVTTNLDQGVNSTWTRLSEPNRTEGHPASVIVLNDGKVVATYSGRRVSGLGFQPSSGIFIYDPATNQWTDVSDDNMHYWTKDIIIDPNDPTQNTWYVGVFSHWGNNNLGQGGLYRTRNRGVNWEKLTGNQLRSVTSCKFNPNNLNQVYVTTETQGLWISNNINDNNPLFTLVESYPFRQPERVYFNPYKNTEMWVTSFGNGTRMTNLELAVTGQKSNQLGINTISVYPNPTNENLYIKSLDINEEIHTLVFIEIASGKIVHEVQNINNPEYKLALKNNLPSGLYLVRVVTNKRVVNTKIFNN